MKLREVKVSSVGDQAELVLFQLHTHTHIIG